VNLEVLYAILDVLDMMLRKVDLSELG